jgi:hypothetical protein
LNLAPGWDMAIIRCTLRRWGIAATAILGLGLTTASGSTCRLTAGVSPTSSDSAASASPKAFSERKEVDEEGLGQVAARQASAAPVKTRDECVDDHSAACSQPLGVSSLKTGHPGRDGHNALPAAPVRTCSRLRALVTRLHRGSWPGHPVAPLMKQRRSDSDDDEASDDPNDDDDAYEDLDVYDNPDDAPIVVRFVELGPFLAATEFAIEIGVAPFFALSSTFEPLRC